MLKGIHANQEGMSLPEVLITVVISGILTLAGATIINLAAMYYSNTVNTLESEIEASQGLYLIKNALVGAVDIRRTNVDIVDANSPGVVGVGDSRTHGLFRTGTSAGFTGVTRTLALFNRETSIDGDRSQLEPTGIAMVGFNAGALTQGALYIYNIDPDTTKAINYTNGQRNFVDFADGNANITVIPRVVRWEVNPLNALGVDPAAAQAVVRQAVNGDLLLSVQLNLTFRFHPSANPQEWCWRANLAAAPCANVRARDVVKSTAIVFRNNRIYFDANDDTVPGNYPKADYRVNGGIYYFLPRGPRVF